MHAGVYELRKLSEIGDINEMIPCRNVCEMSWSVTIKGCDDSLVVRIHAWKMFRCVMLRQGGYCRFLKALHCHLLQSKQ